MTVLTLSYQDEALAGVKKQLRVDYPERALDWLDDVEWEKPQDVPLNQIEYDDDIFTRIRHHEQDKVANFAKKIEGGWKKPVILIRRPRGQLKPIDGHTRISAYHKLKRPAYGWIGTVKTQKGPWDGFHKQQLQTVNSQAFDLLEFAKIVRTPAGEERYKEPIGSLVVDYGGLNEANRDRLDAAIDAQRQHLPDLAGVRKISVVPGLVDQGLGENGHYENGEIKIDPRIFSDESRGWYQQGEESGYHVPTGADPAAYEIGHEIGHALADRVSERGQNPDDDLAPNKNRAEMMRALAEAYPGTKSFGTVNPDTSKVSAYGGTNADEGIAEAWVEHSLGSNPRPETVKFATKLKELAGYGTEPEHEALQHYVDQGYEFVNKLLRWTGDEDELADSLGDDVSDLWNEVDELDAEISRQPPSTGDFTVWRGMRNAGDMQPGSVVSDRAFVSTTRDANMASEFPRSFGERQQGLVVEIRVPAGTRTLDVAQLLNRPEEQEVLLPRDSQFRVESVSGRKAVLQLLLPATEPDAERSPDELTGDKLWNSNEGTYPKAISKAQLNAVHRAWFNVDYSETAAMMRAGSDSPIGLVGQDSQGRNLHIGDTITVPFTDEEEANRPKSEFDIEGMKHYWWFDIVGTQGDKILGSGRTPNQPQNVPLDPASVKLAQWGLRPDNQRDVDKLTAIINGSKPLTQDALVYRSISQPEKVFGPVGELLGTEWTDPAFVSVSANDNIGGIFGAAPPGETRAFIRVHVPAGSHMLKPPRDFFSDVYDQSLYDTKIREYTLAPQTRFRVTGDTQEGLMRYIDLDVVPPDQEIDTDPAAGVTKDDLRNLTPQQLVAKYSHKQLLNARLDVQATYNDRRHPDVLKIRAAVVASRKAGRGAGDEPTPKPVAPKRPTQYGGTLGPTYKRVAEPSKSGGRITFYRAMPQRQQDLAWQELEAMQSRQRKLIPSIVNHANILVTPLGDKTNADYALPIVGSNTANIRINTSRIGKGLHRTLDGWHSEGDGETKAQHSLAHEFGHGVHYALARYNNITGEGHGSTILPTDPKLWGALSQELGVRPPKPNPRGDITYGAIKQWVADNKRVLEYAISRYGATDPKELLADLWAEYSTRISAPNDQPSRLAQIYGDYVRKRL